MTTMTALAIVLSFFVSFFLSFSFLFHIFTLVVVVIFPRLTCVAVPALPGAALRAASPVPEPAHHRTRPRSASAAFSKRSPAFARQPQPRSGPLCTSRCNRLAAQSTEDCVADAPSWLLPAVFRRLAPVPCSGVRSRNAVGTSAGRRVHPARASEAAVGVLVVGAAACCRTDKWQCAYAG